MCPYCNGEMERGVIYSDIHALKWISEKDDKGSLFSTITKGLKLTNLEKDYVDAWYCSACGKIIIDLKTE